MSKGNFNYRVEQLSSVLYQNKTTNYSKDVMNLLAYIIAVAGNKQVVKVSYRTDEWLQDNLKKPTFTKCIGFLKQKDIIQTLLSRKGYFKLNGKMLKNMIAEEVNIKILREIDKQLIQDHKDSLNRRKKKKTNTNGTDTESFMARVSKRAKPKRKDSTDQYAEYRFNPSENPKMNTWREREIKEWRSIDFLGYYICLYKKEMESENISLQNFQAYTKLKAKIKKLLDSWFAGNKKKLKKYIEWAVEHFADEKNER